MWRTPATIRIPTSRTISALSTSLPSPKHRKSTALSTCSTSVQTSTEHSGQARAATMPTRHRAWLASLLKTGYSARALLSHNRYRTCLSAVTSPYCVAVNPGSGEIYVTDAKNYASSGSVLCYSKEGKLLWKATTGDIPACIAFCKK